MVRIISVVNQKGGTGKTTTTVNVASCLARQAHRILLIDMDAQANATLSLGIDPQQLNTSMADVLMEDVKLESIIQATSIEKLSIAPANPSLCNVDLNLADDPNKQFKLKEKMSAILDEYDFIMIDCPPSLSLLPVNALVASQQLLIPMQADFLSLQGLEQLIETLNRIRSEFNTSLKIGGILFCMVDMRLNVAKESMNMVRGHFKDLVFDTVIGQCVKLKEAPTFGMSIFEYDSRSKGAAAYRKATEEIIRRYRIDQERRAKRDRKISSASKI